MIENKSVLIVDDEKNIRLTLSMALESIGLESDEAMNGEEALAKLEKKDYGVVLLDLKMPGMDGIEVLSRMRKTHPDVSTIIITAHGTIDSAVEAMKLGAADFIQKPFAPDEIRELVLKVIDRKKLDENIVNDYASFIELAKRCIQERHFSASMEYVNKAVALDPTRPEAFNFLGAIMEIRGDVLSAQKYYRAALSLDPNYEPARKNLYRATSFVQSGGITLDENNKSN